jgi:hypothetical protein
MKTNKNQHSTKSIFSAALIALAIAGTCLNANAQSKMSADTSKMSKDKMKMGKEKMKMDKMKMEKMKMDKMKMKKDSTKKM